MYYIHIYLSISLSLYVYIYIYIYIHVLRNHVDGQRAGAKRLANGAAPGDNRLLLLNLALRLAAPPGQIIYIYIYVYI